MACADDDVQAKKVTGTPCMVLQLLLPESKQHLHQLLSLYSKQGLLSAQPAHDRAAVCQEVGLTADCHHDAAATIITKPPPSNAILGDPTAGKADAAAVAEDAVQPAQEVAGDASATAAAAASSGGPHWWQRISRQVTCICITELRYGLLAKSCMGCRGAIPLISNLVRWAGQPGVACDHLAIQNVGTQPLCHTSRADPAVLWAEIPTKCGYTCACISMICTSKYYLLWGYGSIGSLEV